MASAALYLTYHTYLTYLNYLPNLLKTSDTWKCVRQNNALIGSSMLRSLGPYWLPYSYSSKDISKLSHST